MTAKRKTYGDTSAKLGEVRRRFLKAHFGGYQQGIRSLIDEAMAAAVSLDEDGRINETARLEFRG